MRYFISLLFLLAAFSSQAQVGIGIVTPDSNAILHLESTEKGFLPPRLTRTERDNIVNPPTGLVIYNTTDSCVQFFDGTCWRFTFQESCDDCYFTYNISSKLDTLDRTQSDSVVVTLNVNQYAGNPSQIALFINGNLPPGLTYYFTNNPINGSGSSDIVFHATPFTPAGTYPVVIQAVCGPSIKNIIYTLVIKPCIEVHITNPKTKYDLTSEPNVPTNTPVCVTVYVYPGVEINSDDPTIPAFTTGPLHPQSIVGIDCKGEILGDGGNGASGGSVPAFGNPGGDGGNALDITVKTWLNMNGGHIFGGGGGGGSVGLGISGSIGPINYNFSFGVGGGGGAGGGLGGTSMTPPPLFQPGQDGTTGLFGYGGKGGVMLIPINIPIGPVTVSLYPAAFGGDGGDYGHPGKAGYLNVGGQACANIPFLGQVCVPLPIPAIPATFPPGGNPGYAVKRNGNTLVGYPDNYYLTTFIKGQIGN